MPTGQALEDVKVLHGIIPHRFRLQKTLGGPKWQSQPQSYIAAHFEALFSNGLGNDRYNKVCQCEFGDGPGTHDAEQPFVHPV